MSDIRKKLENAKPWLLSAVPTSSGRADGNPLYSILFDIITELESLKKSRFDGQAASRVVNTFTTTADDVPAVYIQELSETTGTIQRKVEGQQRMFVDLTTKIYEQQERISMLEKKLAQIEEKLAAFEKEFSEMDSSTSSAFAELIQMITES